MEFIQWSNDLSVDIVSIDEQHKNLVGLINKLFDAMSKGQGRDILKPILEELSAYTVYHFGTEEKYMEEYEFPGLEEHKKIHNEFVEKVSDVKKKYDEGALLISIDLFEFLKNWITEHIMGTDKKYSKFLIEKGVK